MSPDDALRLAGRILPGDMLVCIGDEKEKRETKGLAVDEVRCLCLWVRGNVGESKGEEAAEALVEERVVILRHKACVKLHLTQA